MAEARDMPQAQLGDDDAPSSSDEERGASSPNVSLAGIAPKRQSKSNTLLSNASSTADWEQVNRMTAARDLGPSESGTSGSQRQRPFEFGTEQEPDNDPSKGNVKSSDHGPVNLLYRELPGADLRAFHDHALQSCIASVVICGCIVFAIGHFRFNLAWSILVIGLSTYILRKRVESLRDDFVQDMERKRGKDLNLMGNPGESVEWLNNVVATLWPLINPDLFVAIMDLLEDVMKQLAPGIVTSVRLEDLDLGSNPCRVLSMKTLPAEFPIASKTRLIPDEGEFFQIEMEFAYRRQPPPAPKKRNVHFLVHLGLGLKKLASVEVPVWVELGGIIGTVRLRVQAISDPPFFTYTQVSFPTMPDLSISAKPLKSFDVMTLPLISQYILKSVKAVMVEFTFPKSYTLDVSRILMGSDVRLSVHHIGVLCVMIRRANDLVRCDANGRADPYVALSHSRFGKPVYVTRVISKSLNPSWQEVAFMKITPDAVTEGEGVKLTVYDHDKFTADDDMGVIEIELRKLFENPGKMFDRTDALRPAHKTYKAEADTASDQTKVGGDSKSKVSQRQRTLLDHVANPGNVDSRSGLYADRMREMMEVNLAPRTAQLSGMVSFQIHQLANLELPSRKGHKKSNIKKGPDEGDLPSTYTVTSFNDVKVFETRLKKFAASPYINASYEVFCPDWTTARLGVMVLDARNLEHDGVIGVVSLKLSDLFKERSQITRWFPLVGGLGYGRLRLSMLFKPVDLSLPKVLRCHEVGVLEIYLIKLAGFDDYFSGNIRIRSSTANFELETSEKGTRPALSDGTFFTDEFLVAWRGDRPLRLPIVSRRQARVTIEFRPSTDSLLRKVKVMTASFWLSNMPDEEQVNYQLPLTTDTKANDNNEVEVASPTALSLSQQDPRQRDKDNGDKDKLGNSSSDASHASLVSTTPLSSKMEEPNRSMVVSARFVPGLGKCHSKLSDSLGADFAITFRGWEHAVEAKDRSPRYAANSPATTATTPKLEPLTPSTSKSQDREEAEASNADVDRTSSSSGIPLSAVSATESFNSAWGTVDGESDSESDDGTLARARKRFSEQAKWETGMWQTKPARTMKWLKDSAKKGVGKMKGGSGRQAVSVGAVQEGVSSL